MKAILFALLACLALTLVNAVAPTGTDTCTVSSGGCLNGMVVNSTYYRNYADCRDRIVYTFVKSKCDISNFVTNGARPQNYLGTACASNYGAPGYNKIFCPDFGTLFTTPYKIDTDGGCAGTATVDMIVPSGDYVTGIIGLKGGTDCTTCSLKTYKPLADNTNSLGACKTDPDCDDGNACTIDTCNSASSCSTCTNTKVDTLCTPCLNDTDCAGAPYIDACTIWVCNQTSKTCAKKAIDGCFPCDAEVKCPVIGEEGATCLENVCNANGVCEQQQIPGCCDTPTTTVTTADSCYTCTKKTGCGFNVDYGCVPTNSSSGLGSSNNYTVGSDNCTTFSTGDGSSDGDGGGTDGGTIAAIVVPIVAATVLAALAAGVFGIALAFLIAKKMQKGAIASQLQAIGFTEEESTMIVNSAAYKTTGGENPFFVTTDDSTGHRVLNVGNGLGHGH